MTNENPTFEIHVHGQVFLAEGVTHDGLVAALKPMWAYGKSASFAEGAKSFYDQEAGIQHLEEQGVVQICWTVTGDDDFRMAMEEACQNLNEISATGASLDVDFYDLNFEIDFDSDDDDDEETSPAGPGMPDCDGDEMVSRDDFVTLFVGPTPQAIAKVQRDLLVGNVVETMEEHFEAEDLGGVIREIDKLFEKQLKALDVVMDKNWMSRFKMPSKAEGGAEGPDKHGPHASPHGRSDTRGESRSGHTQRGSVDKGKRPDQEPTGST